MRRLIRLVEGTPQHGRNRVVPAELYHGTSLRGFLDIRASNRFETDAAGKANQGFSTTQDEDVALRFARMKANEDGERWGVVMTLDGRALARDCLVDSYHDDDDRTRRAACCSSTPSGFIQRSRSRNSWP